ncbi:MAG TPA: efflux RND transporter periplasmic adaptor subunit [Verrucomicrobiae bacterium]|nr:efflux RND transporter periplasmic adaptor subunit [Verrucomicrobiae bacterium]
MKKILLTVAVLAVLGTILGVSLKQTSRGRGVKVYMEDAAKQTRLLATVSASGEVKPRIEVNISSQVPGQIVELTVQEGDVAKAGHVLVQLDPQRYRSELQRLEALLQMYRINVEREQVTLKTAEVTLRRQDALHAEKIVSDDLLDQARLNVDSGAIGLRSLGEQVRQAEADLGRARDDLSKTTLRAPISGLVSQLNAKVGEQVIIGTMNNPGTVILTLSDMTEVLAEVRVDETEVTDVKAGQAAKIRVDAVEAREYDGVIESIGNAAVREASVSRFPVKVRFRAPDALLRPGMSAHARIEVEEKKDVLAVPLQAMVRRSLKDYLDDDTGTKRASGASGASGAAGAGGEEFEGKDPEREQVAVLVVEKGGRAKMVKVRTGISDAFRVEILEGIAPGDHVVLGPYRVLRSVKNGDYVRRVEKSEAGDDQDSGRE